MSGREASALCGIHPRVYVDPWRPLGADRREWDAWAATFPEWCKPLAGREQPWFRVAGVAYWASVGVGCGTCRAWIDEGKTRMATAAPNWRLLKMRLATLHGVAVGAVELRPNLPVWVTK